MEHPHRYFVIEDILEDDCILNSSNSLHGPRGAIAIRMQMARENPDGPALGISEKGRGMIMPFEDCRDLLGGTFACPICKRVTPHNHTPQEIADLRKKRKREYAATAAI